MSERGCRIFHRIDQNGNSYISNSELRALIVGIQIEESGLRQDYLVARVMEQFDSSQDHQINEQEFVTGLSNWLMVARDSVSHTDHGIFCRNSAVHKIDKNSGNKYYKSNFIAKNHKSNFNRASLVALNIPKMLYRLNEVMRFDYAKHKKKKKIS